MSCKHRAVPAITGALALAAALATGNAVAADTMSGASDNWQFIAAPYGWFPTINGKLKYSLPPADSGDPYVKIGPNNYLTDLQFAGMFVGVARKGDYSILTDIVYVNLSGLSSKTIDIREHATGDNLAINANLNTGIKSGIYTLAGGYTLARDARSNVDIYAGVRYADLKVSANWDASGPLGIISPSGSASQKVNLTDGIIGVKGQVGLGDDGKWYLPYQLDGGAGSNNWSWNALIAVGYRYDWGDLLVGYRHLAYTSSGDKLVQNLELSGPLVGASFHW
jgi:hypothetical protein